MNKIEMTCDEFLKTHEDIVVKNPDLKEINLIDKEPIRFILPKSLKTTYLFPLHPEKETNRIPEEIRKFINQTFPCSDILTAKKRLSQACLKFINSKKNKSEVKKSFWQKLFKLS